MDEPFILLIFALTFLHQTLKLCLSFIWVGVILLITDILQIRTDLESITTQSVSCSDPPYNKITRRRVEERFSAEFGFSAGLFEVFSGKEEERATINLNPAAGGVKYSCVRQAADGELEKKWLFVNQVPVSMPPRLGSRYRLEQTALFRRRSGGAFLSISS